MGRYHVVTTSHKCIKFGVIVIIVVVTVADLCLLSKSGDHDSVTVSQGDLITRGHCWSLVVIIYRGVTLITLIPGVQVCDTMFV